MRERFFFGLIVFLQIQNSFCQLEFGTIFPIPLSGSNDDPNFQQCPVESGAYPHSTNCSIFHMCTFGIQTIYSCIDGYFFNPTSGKCQYLPGGNEVKCLDIIKQMADMDLYPLAQPMKDYAYNQRRKSATSSCSQAGIYPDVLDCSLFHYCHQNKQHEILKCPNGLHFDPKLFMCSAPQLVNCQYEPPTESTVPDDQSDSTSTEESNPICHDYASGTYLPVGSTIDEFIICGENGQSTRKKCKPGFHYNALTTNCEMKPCAMDTTVCQNDGQCIDSSTERKGFRCQCSIEYQGEFCEKRIELTEITTATVGTTTEGLLQFAHRLTENIQPSTSTNKVDLNLLEKPLTYTDPKIEDQISIVEPITTTPSSLLRTIHDLHSTDHQEQMDQIIRIAFITILLLIGLILLSSILLGVAVCIRLISSTPTETVGTWNILSEESKV